MKIHLSRNKALQYHVAILVHLQCKRATFLSMLPPGCYNYFQSTVLFIGENTVNLLIE